MTSTPRARTLRTTTTSSCTSSRTWSLPRRTCACPPSSAAPASPSAACASKWSTTHLSRASCACLACAHVVCFDDVPEGVDVPSAPAEALWSVPRLYPILRMFLTAPCLPVCPDVRPAGCGPRPLTKTARRRCTSTSTRGTPRSSQRAYGTTRMPEAPARYSPLTGPRRGWSTTAQPASPRRPSACAARAGCHAWVWVKGNTVGVEEPRRCRGMSGNKTPP